MRYFFLFAWACALSAACPPDIAPLPPLPIPAVVPPPVMMCSTPTPDVISDYMPITFVNDSGLDADEIYIAVLVNSSTQYLAFSMDGMGHYLATITDFTPTTYLSDPIYSYPLSSFEMTQADTYTFYIPNTGNDSMSGSNFMKSSRILVSLNEPLTYFINNVGALQVPSDVIATDDNYFILNDKIEFDIGSNGLNRMNLNLTGVDFFGLPLLVQANYKFLFGTTFSDACSLTGMPSTVSYSDVFSGYTDALGTLSSPFDGYWGSLVATYTNPAAVGGGLCNLRIYAPATAMGSTQTQSNPSKVTFPTNYFLSSASSPTSCTWFDAVWNTYYQNKKPVPYLILDATTVSGSAKAVGSEVGSGDFHFVIKGGPDAGKTMVFPLPTSSKAFFTGAVSDYEPAISTGGASAATVAQVFKVFATSIISGIIPINCQQQSPITLSNSYARDHSAEYFENNTILTSALSGCSCVSNVPWFDFYSRALLTIGAPNLFYTSAYSDFLGSDGTIVIVNLASDNAAATITVNINDLSAATIPNPYADTTSYDLTVGKPSDTDVEYGTSKMGPFSSMIPSSAAGNEIFLKVTYNEGTYSGMSFITQIAPAAEVFHPVLPGQGMITTTGTNTTINIGASPK